MEIIYVVACYYFVFIKRISFSSFSLSLSRSCYVHFYNTQFLPFEHCWSGGLNNAFKGKRGGRYAGGGGKRR